MEKYLVLGMGKSGISTFKALKGLGFNVKGTDKRSLDEIDLNEINASQKKSCFLETNDAKEKLEEFDIIIKSPGVSFNNDIVKMALKKNIRIIDEIELSNNFLKPYMDKLIVITGTNGKTTTTTLIGEIVKSAGHPCHVVGNIGKPISSLIGKINKKETVVCEVSSFQLECIIDFRPDIALLLNLAPDHLDRHKTFENYINAKMRLFENQGKDDARIINYDDEKCVDLASNLSGKVLYFSKNKMIQNGASVENNKLVMKRDGKSIEVIRKEDINIPGEHNIDNMLASLCVANLLDIPGEISREVIASFEGVEHRLEKVGNFKGITFYNDSKATNVNALNTALEALKSTGYKAPLVLILGGMDKGEPFDALVLKLKKIAARAIVYGETKSRWIETMEKYNFKDYNTVNNLQEAVKKAYSICEDVGTVLFSPGCASWDMFSSFEERGRIFKTEVIKLGRG